MDGVRELTDDVRELAARVEAYDQVAPLNEEAWLELESGGGDAWHFSHREKGRLVGYLQWQPGVGTGQLMVDPQARRRGIGTSLVGGLVCEMEGERGGRGDVNSWNRSPTINKGGRQEERGGRGDGSSDLVLLGSRVGGRGSDEPSPGSCGFQLWAFGDLEGAKGFAGARGMVPVRELWMMELSVSDELSSLAGGSHLVGGNQGDGSSDLVLRNGGVERLGQTNRPRGGISIRAYREGDAPALLEVNAAAFAHHPEQGGLDPAGLEARMGEPWFDPRGLLLAFDDEGLAGFHWTKRHDATTGEVYVIGVAPRAQGRGLGRVLLDAGLAHLARSGCAKIVLYVDSGDVVAVNMYKTAGFTLAHRDVLYASCRKDQR